MKHPDFIICGTQKGGTTALGGQLRKHKQIFMPPNEQHFFDKTQGASLTKYCSVFRGAHFNGEKTPRYMADPVAMTHIAQVLPDVKLIFLLRDPVRRFVSNCRHWNKLTRGPHKGMKHFVRTREGMNALWKGCYDAQLYHVFTLFPRERIHIEFSEQMRADPQAVMERVQRFIGVEPDVLGNSPKPERVVERKIGFCDLVDYYRSHNHAVSELLIMYGYDAFPIADWYGMPNNELPETTTTSGGDAS